MVRQTFSTVDPSLAHIHVLFVFGFWFFGHEAVFLQIWRLPDLEYLLAFLKPLFLYMRTQYDWNFIRSQFAFNAHHYVRFTALICFIHYFQLVFQRQPYVNLNKSK